MSRYQVSLEVDHIIIAQVLSTDLTAAVKFALEESAKSADLIASRARPDAGEVWGRFTILTWA